MKTFFQKLSQIVLLALFFINSVVPPDFARAQLVTPPLNLLVPLSQQYSPVIVRGLSIYPDDPFKFDFIIDSGDDNLSGAQFKTESEKLIKYFLAALTVPEKELWVNLSPYEKDRVVPEGLGDTQMGIDMLAQDYLLKRITASLTYPDSDLGKKFWDRVYQKAYQRFGTTNIPVKTFNKVWIAPDVAVVYEKDNHVFIADRHLKVMLEKDYLALTKASVVKNNETPENAFQDSLIKEIVIPEIEKEVNQGKNFATLRQIYNSLILATWYKKKIKDSILAYAYANKNKVTGININDPLEKERIYQQYLHAFKKGVYNYIKEDLDPSSGETIPRKYFSGGLTVGAANIKDLTVLTNAAQLSSGEKDFIIHPGSSGHDLKVTWQAVENKINANAAQSTIPTPATILDARESYPQQPINPVADFPAREFPDIRTADRKPGEIPLFIDISDDLKTLTYYEVLDDSKVYAPDGSIHYDALSVANGSIKEIASFPSSYLVSPRKWMLDHFKDSPEGRLIDKIWTKGKRYTRYGGITTSWDMQVDKDVWSTNIDTVFMHKELLELGALSLAKEKVKKVTEVGVGGGGISSLLAQTFPDAELSITDISAYALSTTLLNIIANHPKGAAALEHVKKYWGKGIAALEGNQDLILINPPYIPEDPEEQKPSTADPYRGTGLIREIIKDGYKKLNPDNPEASIYINISSLADKDLKGYLQEFGGNIEFEPVGEPLKVPLKIRWISERWKQWLLNVNGGLQRIENPAADQEEYWHTLQMYRIRRKAEVVKPKRVAIIGGTFDPFHIAHRKMVEDVKAELGVDEVIVVPTSVSPHKQGIATAPGEIRYQMAKAALAGMEGVKVSDFEINREGTSYSIDLVNHIEAQYPRGSKFFFVIGDDNIEKLDTWKDIDELVDKVKFVTYSRPGYEKTNRRVPVMRIEHPAIDISATIIRRRVALGLPISRFVSPEVERLIHQNSLYLPEDVFTPDNHDPILSLNGQPFKEDKPFVLVADAHGTLLMSNWKKEYAQAFHQLTGKSLDLGLQWVEENIVRQMIDTTRDVPFDDIVTMLNRELALDNIHKTREEIEDVIRTSRSIYWTPEMAEAMPGAIEALREIKKMGIPVRIVSGTRSSQLVYDQLQHAGFGDLISQDEVFAKDRQLQIPVGDTRELTPRERTIKHIMDGYPGHNLLLLDDWIEGAELAKRLNGTFIALPQGKGLEQKRNANRLRAEGTAMEITDEKGYERFVSLLKVLNTRREEHNRQMETKNVRVAMAQFNPTVGNLVENFNRMSEKIEEAKKAQADLIVFPELAVTGYLPGDLLKNREFVDQNKKMVKLLAAKSKGIATVVGFVDINQWGQIYNALAVLSDGEVKGIYRKRALPDYGHFMEGRYFIPGELGLFDFQGNRLNKDIFNIDGLMFGINDCEDIWVEKDGYKTIDGTTVQEPVHHHVVAPYKQQADLGARLIINASASPYRDGVLKVRDDLLIKRAKEIGATIVYLNTVGGQDETVFDGNSLVVSADGQIMTRGKAFEEQMIITDIPVKTEKRTERELSATISLKKSIPDAEKKVIPPVPLVAESSAIELKFKAAVLAIRDYARKNGFKKVNFGNSGGVDSGVVGALAAIAMGPENVNAMSLPTEYNSPDTKSDARRLAERLGIHHEEVPIQGPFKAIRDQLLAKTIGLSAKAIQIAIENLQPRLRMVYLMFRSNAEGYLLLGTGNKSEIAVGYMTLYGDMAGGFDPIKDLYKTEVFEMARYINQYLGKEIIPESMINRPPSAELREGQKDTDSLPDYVTELDPILRKMIDESLPDNEIVRQTKLPLEMVIRVRKLVDGADHKRRQAQIGPKLSQVAFGHYERRMPLTKQWNAQSTAAFIAAQPSVNQAMATDMVPLHRVFGEKRIVELKSDKGPIRMEISEFNDKEIHTVLLNPENVEDAHVTLAHSIDTADDVLQAILIMSHLRQYKVGKIDLLIKGQRFTGLEDGEDSADSYLLIALSIFANGVSYIDQKNFVHEVKNIQPFPEITKQNLPLHIDRLLYLNNQFQSSAEEAVKMLSSKARAEHITVQNRYGLRFVELPADLKGKNVVVYHSTESSDEIIDLVLTLIGLRRAGVNSISLVNSYLGYARQDKISIKGETVAAASVLGLINRLVDHDFVINAHYGKATGLVALTGFPGTSIYNLNGFIPTAEYMLNKIISNVTGFKVEGLSWDTVKRFGPMIKDEFQKHPVLIVGPDKGSRKYSQEAAAELKRLVKAAYGVDIPIYVGYLPKERNPETGEIKRSESPSILDIDTDQPLTQLGDRPLTDAWAFVLDDMTDTGGTLLSATYILVKKLRLQWRRVFTGIVHGVLSQKLVPFKTGLSADQINYATSNTLPDPQFIDDVKGRMPPVLLTAMRTLLLPQETPTFKQVPMQNLIGYVIRRIIGAGLSETRDPSQDLTDILEDNSTPFWELSPQDYLFYLNGLRRNHTFPKRDLEQAPVYTSPEVIRNSRGPQNLNGPAQPNLDEPGLTADELEKQKQLVHDEIMSYAPGTLFVDGRPRNDLKTGMKGRGKLFKYGPNQAEDPVLLRFNQEGELETLIIDRSDDTGFGFPGGFSNRGQENLAGYTATREAIEEVLSRSKYAVDFREGKVIYDAKAFSSRDTDDAWVTTRASAVLLSFKQSQLLTVSASDDAKPNSARWERVQPSLLSKMVDAHPEILKRAVEAVMSGDIQVRDDLVKPKDQLLEEVSHQGPANDAMSTAAENQNPVTTPNTLSDSFNVAIDPGDIDKPLTEAHREELIAQLKRLNPGYPPDKLFHMMPWDPLKYDEENMPAVVGVVKNHEAFSKQNNLRILDMAIRMPGQGWAIPKALEQFKEVILMAIEHERLTNPDFEKLYYVYITIDQKLVEPHKTQRRPGWHGDAFVSSATNELEDENGLPKEVITDHTYVISDVLTTLHLPGPFPLRGVDAENIPQVLEHFDKLAAHQTPFRYPPYTLACMTPYDLHSVDTNVSNETIDRTFVKIQFSRDRLNREGNAINPLLTYDNWQWVPRGQGRNNRNEIADYQRKDKVNFRLVDPNKIDFNQHSVNLPWVKPQFFWSVKTEGVKARRAILNEKILTAHGDDQITYNIAKEGDWVVTTSQGDSYILTDQKFRRRYETVPDLSGIYPPIAQPAKMLEITEPVRFRAQWGAMQYVPAGSVLAKIDDEPAYAIHRENFLASYQITDAQGSTRTTSTITTKSQFQHVLENPFRLSKYHLNFRINDRDWKLDFQLPGNFDLNKKVDQVTFVLDMDETLAGRALTGDTTPENLNQIMRAFRLMKNNPTFKVRFIINSANTYKRYALSRFGKKLKELANDPFVKGMRDYPGVLDEIRADLIAQGISDPDQVRMVISRRKPIRDRLVKLLIERAQQEGLEDYLKNIEIRTLTGGEIIEYNPIKKDFTFNPNPQLILAEKEQLDISKILLPLYLTKLGEKLKIDFNEAIGNIRDAHGFLDTPTSTGVLTIFEKALGTINARVVPFNGEVGIIFYDEQSKVDGNALSLEVMSQLKQQGLVKPYRPYFVQGDDVKGIKVSLFDKGVETRRMVSPDEYVVAAGDVPKIDTFLSHPPTKQTIAMSLGAFADVKDQPSVITALGQDGKDIQKEAGTAVLMDHVLTAMEQGKTWGDVQFINNLFSPNEVLALLPDKAMKSSLGGINFDPAMMNLQIKKDGQGVSASLYRPSVATINISGITPVIIKIQPMTDLSTILGLNEEAQEPASLHS